MSSDLEPYITTRILQLEHQQVQLRRYLIALKRRLDELHLQFHTRPELQQLAELQKRLDELLENRVRISPSPETDLAISVDLIPTTPLLDTEVILSPSKSELVFDRSGSRDVVIEALSTAEERVIIVCPWLNSNSINEKLLQKMRDCLNRNCKIDIGWGSLGDRHKIGTGLRYNALEDLQQLEQEYPDLFRLKLLGTHENYVVCDVNFAMVGSHNILTSGVHSAEREVGIRTTDPQIIQGLIRRFDHTEETKKSDIFRRFSGNLERVEEEEFEVSQKPVVTAEEFLKRYNEGERDFTGINLAGVNLTGKSFYNKINLSKANLRGANLSHVNLSEANLTGANLSLTNLKKADLRDVNLSSAKLQRASMDSINLSRANLNNANLTDASLHSANLIATNLIKADLRQANLDNAKLLGSELNSADLRASKLSNADLSGADLTNAKLGGADFNNTKLTGTTMPDGKVHE